MFETTFRNLDDTLRKDAGCSGELDYIEQQEKLLNDEEVLNLKGEPIRSWFRDGRFVPSIGIFGLFDGKAITWKKGTEKAMLEAFKKSYLAGDFASYIKVVDKKREENTAKLLDARKKIGKTDS
jgi:hypothetical protein